MAVPFGPPWKSHRAIKNEGGDLSGQCDAAQTALFSPRNMARYRNRGRATKTDLQLQNHVMAELQWELAVQSDIDDAILRRAATNAKPITVDVMGSTVTFTGDVHGMAERGQATESAWGSPGVHNVFDKMTLVY